MYLCIQSSSLIYFQTCLNDLHVDSKLAASVDTAKEMLASLGTKCDVIEGCGSDQKEGSNTFVMYLTGGNYFEEDVVKKNHGEVIDGKEINEATDLEQIPDKLSLADLSEFSRGNKRGEVTIHRNEN